ncbi:hypothetical protein JCM11491_001728 [Sporobolomyces phaffii]
MNRSTYRPPEDSYLSLPGQPGFCAWLVIDGVPAPCYGLQETPRKTTCYVESRAGAHFAVHFAEERTQRRKGFQAAVLIDGQWQRGKNITAEAPPGLWSLSARRDSESTERPFVFGALSKTSVDELASTSEVAYKSVGTVELRYRRIKKVKARPPAIKGEFDTPEVPTFHEDSKAALLAHQGRLGPSQIAQFKEERQNKFIYHESKDNPYHTFTFCYRSRAFLESRNLLNPMPSTSYPAQNTASGSASNADTSTAVARSLSSSTASSSSSSSSRSTTIATTSNDIYSYFRPLGVDLDRGVDPVSQRRLSGTAETELFHDSDPHPHPHPHGYSYLHPLAREPAGECDSGNTDRSRVGPDESEGRRQEEADELRKLEDELERLRRLEQVVQRKKRESESGAGLVPAPSGDWDRADRDDRVVGPAAPGKRPRTDSTRSGRTPVEVIVIDDSD